LASIQLSANMEYQIPPIIKVDNAAVVTAYQFRFCIAVEMSITLIFNV
jgi:hypothetical protein